VSQELTAKEPRTASSVLLRLRHSSGHSNPKLYRPTIPGKLSTGPLVFPRFYGSNHTLPWVGWLG
jgi:hypothetical protein